MNTFNTLISSVSKKVPLIKSVQKAYKALHLEGKIFGGDSDNRCIGRFFVDEFWQMPSLEKLPIETFLKECQKRKITAIIPTRDGELPYYSQYHDIFNDNGISCMISNSETIQTCRDKFLFSRTLIANNFPAIPSFNSLEEVQGETFVVKERFGAGSRRVGLNLNAAEAQEWALELEDPIFQPYIHGTEYSVDIFLQSGKTHGIIARQRSYIVDGESQVTISVHDPVLESLCISIAESINISGHAVLQVLKDASGEFHIIECNPRFGGASTLSLAMGLNSFVWFFQKNLKQPLTPFVRSKNEKQQVRYPEDFITNLPTRGAS